MNVLAALGLTLFAGLATGLGSAIAFFARQTNYRFLSLATGFSGGVMLYVSFVEILPKGGQAIAAAYGTATGMWLQALAFFSGIALIAIIDNLIPSAGNPHEAHSKDEIEPLHNVAARLPDFQAIADHPETAKAGAHDHRVAPDKLLRMGLFTACLLYTSP
ncbi:MAG: zinc transporter ZupT, partial [Planctomycetota bacterium]|nr:zinc transporter ZupT [Planctomycetota bacterium]